MNELEIKRTPETIGAEIRTLEHQARCMTLWFGVEIGRRLREAKELLEHGQWGTWLQEETDMSASTASRFMKLYDEYGADQIGIFGAETKSSTLQNLSISNALRLLAVPENEREAFAEEHDVEHMSARDLDALIRERDEASRQKEAAEHRAKEAETELERLKEEAAEAEKEQSAAERELQEARSRITELENRPVEVAVQVDEEAVRRAAEEAKAEAQKEIERLEKKLAAADKKREKAEADARAAEEKLQTAGSDAIAERDRMAEELAETKRKLEMADVVTAQFKIVFNAAQSDMNELLGLIAKADGPAKDKLREAARRLLQEFSARV